VGGEGRGKKRSGVSDEERRGEGGTRGAGQVKGDDQSQTGPEQVSSDAGNRVFGEIQEDEWKVSDCHRPYPSPCLFW
jgi:hypothetical protein